MGPRIFPNSLTSSEILIHKALLEANHGATEAKPDNHS
jgi:hypothetical protein